MHNKNYNIKVAFCCNENLMKCLEEVKAFLGFKYYSLNNEKTNFLDKGYDLLVVDLGYEKLDVFKNSKIPKILLLKSYENENGSMSFDSVLRLPLNLFEFNQTIINLSQKYKFNKNSLIKIKDYILDKNERVLKKGNKQLRVTEKEIYFIETLFSLKKPLNKNYILKNIWNYSDQTDTHTVETHIYRLRQKIKECFQDEKFLIFTKDGYAL